MTMFSEAMFHGAFLLQTSADRWAQAGHFQGIFIFPIAEKILPI